jgi:hypothetical protein
MGVTWLVIAVALILAVVVIAAVRRDDPFQSTARNLELKLTRSVPDLLPRLEGMINGLPVRVEVPEQRDTGVNYTVFYPPLGMALKLERETTITRTLGQLGENDTQVGARAFDDSFRVNTSRPDALRDMMNPGLRRALVQLIERHPKIVVADGAITLVTETLEPTAEELTATIVEMATVAHQLVSNRPPPLERPSPPPTQVTKVPAPPAATAPKSEESREEAKQPASVEPAMPQPPVSVPEPPKAAPPTSGLPDGFFEDVFGANRLSFESSDSFDEQIRGTQVTLSGKIKQARDQASDGDGDEVVTAATITVAQIDSDLYGKTDIDAIVRLPPGTATGLERGDIVTFEGTVDDVDAFMRNLFIGNAKLVD